MKKILSVLLVLFLAVSFMVLVGCSQKEAAAPATPVAAVAAADQPVAKNYVGKVGISLPTATHGYMGRVNW